MIFVWGLAAVKKNPKGMDDIEVRAGIEEGLSASQVSNKILDHSIHVFHPGEWAVKVTACPVKDLGVLNLSPKDLSKLMINSG